ncbi:Rho GTPase activation protein [Xylariaceae sp. FL0662B]|nr:Rho GTPase activation protein [Xylariaceae sp. FL0662B]
MESLSITTDCITLGSTIAVLILLNGFVREVREARSDVDGVCRELYSLQSVLDLLKEDAGLFPPELAGLTPAVLARCSKIAEELDTSISTFNEFPRSEKRAQWLATGRKEGAKFRTSLEAHKAVLGLALDLVGATTIRDATSDKEPNKRNTIERHQNTTHVLEDVSRILIEMSQLRMRMPGEFEKSDADFSLHEYMTCLKSYAETIVSMKESEHEAEREGKAEQNTEQEVGRDIDTEAGGADNDDETDENIDQGAFLGSKELFGAYVGDSPDSAIDMTVEPALSTLKDALAKNSDENIPNIEQLISDVASVSDRAPTPPPKDIKRLRLARNTVISPFEATPDSPTLPNTCGVVTEISSTGRAAESAPSITNRSKGLGKFFAPIKNAISENRPQTRSTSSSGATEAPPPTPMIQASLVRRGSKRLSVSFKRRPAWNPDLIAGAPEGPDSNGVFGVSLQKSMQVAKGTSKTHHSGNGGSSRRDFPLCIQKCCFFLKNEGVEAPDIFAEPGDGFRVQKLKEIFSTAPEYGEHVDWTDFSVYDAADLITLYLSQLPKPLVSEPIAKRWIALSRQATVSGSHGTRLDQCIDFWEEALGGLRGPSRTLFKLLLNLWADIANASDNNDMTAERLAGCILNPLMHTTPPKYSTDYMLSIAFLIRKRTEYTDLIKKDQSHIRRISRAAW